MSLNIIEFVRRLTPSASRSDSETDLSISLEAIQTITDSCVAMSEVEKVAKFSSRKGMGIVKDFYDELHKISGMKVKLHKKFPTDMVTLFANVRTNGSFFQKELEDLNGEVIVTQALTVMKANVIRAVGHYYFMTRYAMDLINYIYVMEAEHGGIEFTSEGQLKKSQIEFIEKNLWIFARLLSVYGDLPEVLNDRMKKLTPAMLPKDSMDEVSEMYSSGELDMLNNLPSGFLGSPIYSIRLIFSQWEADRYRHMKDKKRLLELRLLHLRMLKENGQSDIQMEKEMTYLQKSVTDLDYRISKIEADCND